MFRYTIKMHRASENFREPAKAYTLRVILREADKTVLHFHSE